MKFILVVVFAQIISILIGIVIVVFENKTCLSNSCKELSDEIKQNLNFSVNPCDDFYQFTCGKVLNRNDSESTEMLKGTALKQMARVFHILKEGPEPGEPNAFTKTKTIFKKCIEDNASSDESLEKIRGLFKEMGGFPVFQGSQWNDTGWTWLETTRKIINLGFDCCYMFQLEVIMNPYDHKMYLGTQIPEFSKLESFENKSLECETLFNDTFYKTLLEYGVSKQQAEEGAVQIYNLEKLLYELSKNHTSLDDLNIDEHNTRNLTNMTTSFGYIDWPKLVSFTLQEDYVPNSFKVLVMNSGYMEGLKNIFQSTSSKVKANYMMWKVLELIKGNYLHPGNKTEGECFEFIKNSMDFVLTQMYLEKYPDPRGSDLDPILKMVDLIKDDILTEIKNLDWMSDHAKERSIRKIMLIKQRIGDLKVLNQSFVEEFYQGLSVEGNAFEAMLSVVKFSTNKMVKFIGSSGILVLMAAFNEFEANAFYLSMDNSMIVLHGILQKPMYDSQWPGSINYGRIGTIVGHEITHALDETGHRYDEHGDLKDTWDPETNERFNKTSQCLVDQFNAFYNDTPFWSANYSGAHRSAENMADTGGTKLAFQAYRNYTETMFWPDFLLPGLDYSSNQLFFISFALTWCTKNDEKELAEDEHAPAEYRVLTTLRNSPYFAEAFNCHQGDGMRSGIKCKVW